MLRLHGLVDHQIMYLKIGCIDIKLIYVSYAIPDALNAQGQLTHNVQVVKMDILNGIIKMYVHKIALSANIRIILTLIQIFMILSVNYAIQGVYNAIFILQIVAYVKEHRQLSLIRIPDI